MKLRIKGNSIRIRLNKPEVKKICDSGYLQETTAFGKNTFTYALQRVDNAAQLSAVLEDNKITMHVPAALIEDWTDNNTVGFDSHLLVNDQQLYLLLEKDFICLDETTEDQSDNYENPNKTC